MLYTRENDVLPKTIAGKEKCQSLLYDANYGLERANYELEQRKEGYYKSSSACRYLLISVHL